jgi:DNA sulfur modification protein DndD
MIIKSIKLSNFQCYHGEDNCFEFTEGLNVIIGDNSAGKSKLYDAFTWALFEECFETETRKTKKTIAFKSNLVSDKAKALAAIEDSITAEVVLTFYNRTLRGDEQEYIVKRSYTIVKKTETDWYAPNHAQLTVYQRDVPRNPVLILDEPQEYIYKNLLPRNIRPYTWFQGEQVDDLIDFDNKKALTDAINVLSDISQYKTYVDFATKSLEAVEIEYKKEAKRFGADKQKLDDLSKNKEKKEREIVKISSELSDAEKNWTYAHEKITNLIGQLEDAKNIGVLQERLLNIERQLDEKEQTLERLKIQMNKSVFTKHWVLRNVGDLVEAYGKKFDAYEQKRAQEMAEKNATEKVVALLKDNLETVFTERLPKGNPEPIYLKRMLEQEKCLVCDRNAKRYSEAWLKIKELLDRTKAKPADKEKPTTTQNDFHAMFKDFYQTGLKLQDNIFQTDERIQTELSKIQTYFDEIKGLKMDWKKTDDTIQQFVSGSKLSVENSTNIMKDFGTFTQKQAEYADLKAKKAALLLSTEKELEKIETDIAEVVKGKMPQYLEEKKQLLTDFKQIAISTQDRVFNNLIVELEEEANKHFTAMTKGNEGIQGYIKLVEKEGNYMPKNVDANGQELPNINDSNIILIKVAVILAIISAKKSSQATDLYTLITDAPSSKFTDNYTIGFCKTVGKVYKQSIIMSKDFHANKVLRARLLNVKEVPNLGNVYTITPAIEANNRFDRNTLSTKIQKIR